MLVVWWFYFKCFSRLTVLFTEAVSFYAHGAFSMQTVLFFAEGCCPSPVVAMAAEQEFLVLPLPSFVPAVPHGSFFCWKVLLRCGWFSFYAEGFRHSPGGGIGGNGRNPFPSSSVPFSLPFIPHGSLFLKVFSMLVFLS